MKKLACLICMAVVFTGFTCVGAVSAMDEVGQNLIAPAVDFDMLVIRNKQSKTVTADLSFLFDFQVIPVVVAGRGTLNVSLSKTNTTGEILYIYLYGFDDYLVSESDFNIGTTPVTLKVSSTSGYNEYNIGLVVTGILYSPVDPPYEYNVSFSY